MCLFWHATSTGRTDRERHVHSPLHRRCVALLRRGTPNEVCSSYCAVYAGGTQLKCVNVTVRVAVTRPAGMHDILACFASQSTRPDHSIRRRRRQRSSRRPGVSQWIHTVVVVVVVGWFSGHRRGDGWYRNANVTVRCDCHCRRDLLTRLDSIVVLTSSSLEAAASDRVTHGFSLHA